MKNPENIQATPIRLPLSIVGLVLIAGLSVAVFHGADFSAANAKGFQMSQFQKPSPEQLKQKLTKEQFHVTQEAGTERPFKNEFWDSKKEGIYVDVVSGEPLFSSTDKFDSGTGWPSFTRPIDSHNIVTKVDRKLFSTRVEVRSKLADSHLGHVFEDGPAPTGLRYCMNSASMRFVPAENLKDEGYVQFAGLFEERKDAPSTNKAAHETATLAGGCFWGVEDILRKLPGVIETDVGYTGGVSPNPTYEEVKKGATGHTEAVQIKFDSKKISYAEILSYFFRLHDPTTINRQGNDIGSQYRSAVFYHSEAQRKTATELKEKVDKSGKWKSKVVTEIVEAKPFTLAEDYHQDYLFKKPDGYTCHYLRD